MSALALSAFLRAREDASRGLLVFVLPRFTYRFGGCGNLVGRMSKIVKYAGYVNATGICGLFDAWTVKFDKILGVVSDGRSGLNLLGRLMPVSAFAGRFRLLANRRSQACSVRA